MKSRFEGFSFCCSKKSCRLVCCSRRCTAQGGRLSRCFLPSSSVNFKLSQIPIPVPDLNEFLDRTLTWSLVHADTKLQKEAAWHIIASILNKRVDGECVLFLSHLTETNTGADASGFPDNMLGKYWSDEISNGSQAVERRQHAIQAWGWVRLVAIHLQRHNRNYIYTQVSKALLVRNHALAPQFTDRFFQVFGEEAVSWDAARAVGEIVASDLILTKRNHSVIKVSQGPLVIMLRIHPANRFSTPSGS